MSLYLVKEEEDFPRTCVPDKRFKQREIAIALEKSFKFVKRLSEITYPLSSSFVVDYRDPQNGSRQRLTLRDPRPENVLQALMRVAQIDELLARGINPKLAGTCGELFDGAYSDHIEKNNRSWLDDKSRFNTHIREWIGALRPEQVTPSLLQRLIGQLSLGNSGEGKLAEGTINRIKSLIKVFFKRLVDWGYLDNNPARHLQLNSERSQRNRIVGDAELLKFFAALADFPLQFRLFILFLLFTTVRLTEALACMWSAVSIEQRLLWLLDTKSGKPRAVPLSAGALEVIAELARIRKNQYLFFGKSGGHMARPTRLFNKFKAMTGMHDLWLHDLRRTGASFACRNGASMHDVSKLLGHSNVLVTERYVVVLPAE